MGKSSMTIQVERNRLEQIKAAASKRGLTVSNYVRMILYRELEAN